MAAKKKYLKPGQKGIFSQLSCLKISWVTNDSQSRKEVSHLTNVFNERKKAFERIRGLMLILLAQTFQEAQNNNLCPC